VGVKKKQHIEAIAKICRLPLILGGAGADIMDLDYLGSLGVRVCLQGHQPALAAIMATYDTLMALREGVLPADIESMIDGDLLNKLSRVDDYDRWIEDFLE
jgi:carboxyvinyl-carboxyphosphonate phosphorylmutase